MRCRTQGRVQICAEVTPAHGDNLDNGENVDNVDNLHKMDKLDKLEVSDCLVTWWRRR